WTCALPGVRAQRGQRNAPSPSCRSKPEVGVIFGTGPLFDAETRRKRELTAEAQRRRETLWIDFGLPSGHALFPGFGRRGGRGMRPARVAGLSRKLELFSECGRGRPVRERLARLFRDEPLLSSLA